LIISLKLIFLAYFGSEADSKGVNEQTSAMYMIVYSTPNCQTTQWSLMFHRFFRETEDNTDEI